jgi:hypothetical protein
LLQRKGGEISKIIAFEEMAGAGKTFQPQGKLK